MQTGTKLRRKENRLGERRKAVPLPTLLTLAVRAGGRCEFYGCNEYLLRDDLTLSDLNHSNVAHIVAAKTNGPRGEDPMLLVERNRIENLMLVCRTHHALIDNPEYVREYPKERLLGFKKEHEDRILP